MADIKAGMIVSMKTTGDDMFVLSVGAPQGFHTMAGMLSGVLVKVRRPILLEHGEIQYKIEDYLLDELETKEEGIVRKAAELEALKAQFKKSTPVTPLSTISN